MDWFTNLQASYPMERYIVTGLTSLAVIFNVYVCIHSLAMAKALESGCHWVCRSVGIQRVMHVLYAMTTVCFILAILKAWSIMDVFIGYWYSMSHTYHVRAFAYLAENFGVPMTFYAVLQLIKGMTTCKTARDLATGKMIMIPNGGSCEQCENKIS